MKKLLLIITLFLLCLADSSLAEDVFSQNLPVDEELAKIHEPKYTEVTKLRVEAFQNAPLSVDIEFLANKKVVNLYKVSDNQKFLQRIKIPNSKILKYTDGSYDIKFKNLPDVIFSYSVNGKLISFAKKTNNGKLPCFLYHYGLDGKIFAIELRTTFFRSYTYDLSGFLSKYAHDNKVFNSKGELIKKTSGYFSVFYL